ncbi:MAG: UPF0280 family protein [Alphaproteobacteria bacterium]
MFAPAQMALLPDGQRLHLNHGPIDLIVQAFGDPDEIKKSYKQAMSCFPDILPTLVDELQKLRQLYNEDWQPDGRVASHMQIACSRFSSEFVTPMAAVAGAVADEVLRQLVRGRQLEKAYVNNGGDIAFHLTEGQSLTAGLVADYHLPNIDGECILTYDMPVRGIATSGWKGRSLSFGIADSVSVLAKDAASADVAATLIANDVNADHRGIKRVPASEQDLDSDLGERLVTVEVGALDQQTVDAALNSGEKAAVTAEQAGHITAAVLVLQNNFRVVGAAPAGLIAEAA